MATPGGFEPPISTVTGWHVRPLHHGAVVGNISDASKVYQGCIIVSNCGQINSCSDNKKIIEKISKIEYYIESVVYNSICML
jgi:hypothetical protein